MPLEPNSLKVRLRDWTEIESAMTAVIELLGIIDFEKFPYSTKSKHVFWTVNPVGSLATDLLDRLVTIGILERRYEDEIEYRWNEAFRGSWER
jgi:hypothetical protein